MPLFLFLNYFLSLAFIQFPMRQANSSLIAQSQLSQKNIQTVAVEKLRKINPTDKFPCFSCFDQDQQRKNCQKCNRLGYIKGDHPMVKFVDDFLTKNLMAQLKLSNTNKEMSINDSNSSDEEFLENKMTIKRLQSKSALASYQIRDSESSNQPLPPKLINSLNAYEEEEEIHSNYQCDECRVYPIKGKRFHCKECEDYDLCKDCFLKSKHGHEMVTISLVTQRARMQEKRKAIESLIMNKK